MPVEDAYAQPLIRYRMVNNFGLDDDALNLLEQDYYKVVEEEEEGRDIMAEFMYLVVFPGHKKLGREGALELMRRWPKFKPHWHRVRRRVCDYCGRRNDLSEPRLCVCSGCGVARYCDEQCQANDFSHHAKCCQTLARRWNGVGPIPKQLFDLPDCWAPAVLPSARARERIQEWFEEKTAFLYK